MGVLVRGGGGGGTAKKDGAGKRGSKGSGSESKGLITGVGTGVGVDKGRSTLRVPGRLSSGFGARKQKAQVLNTPGAVVGQQEQKEKEQTKKEKQKQKHPKLIKHRDSSRLRRISSSFGGSPSGSATTTTTKPAPSPPAGFPLLPVAPSRSLQQPSPLPFRGSPLPSSHPYQKKSAKSHASPPPPAPRSPLPSIPSDFKQQQQDLTTASSSSSASNPHPNPHPNPHSNPHPIPNPNPDSDSDLELHLDQPMAEEALLGQLLLKTLDSDSVSVEPPASVRSRRVSSSVPRANPIPLAHILVKSKAGPTTTTTTTGSRTGTMGRRPRSLPHDSSSAKGGFGDKGGVGSSTTSTSLGGCGSGEDGVGSGSGSGSASASVRSHRSRRGSGPSHPALSKP